MSRADSTQLVGLFGGGQTGAVGLPAEPSAKVANAAAGLPRDRHGMPRYAQSERSRLVRTTAFSCKENEPGAYKNLNATGTELRYTSNIRSAAADWSRYPLGTKFKIKGLPYTYIVDDYGSGLVGAGTLDIYHPCLESMRAWGTRKAEVTVIQWGSFERSAALLSRRQQYPHCHAMYAAILRQHGSQVAMSR
jgi:3D (Asp-Asp-Asp) domain-containing protein